LENLQNERHSPGVNPIDSENNNTKWPTQYLQDIVDKDMQNNWQEEEEKEQTSEQIILTMQQMVSKDGHPSKSVDKRRKMKSPTITIRTTLPTIPSGSTVKATFDPTTISDKYLFDLHGSI
jgi:hypothetical protein